MTDATEKDQSQWTVETLREYILAQIDSNREHVLAQIDSNDVKYRERFESSQSAINAAFLAQQTAMQTALTAQKLAIDTALAAADRAVSKAETSTDKRFDSLNEFRAALSDLQSAFMPRLESVALLKAIEDKMETQRFIHEKDADENSKSLADMRLAMLHLLSTEAYETRHTELQRQVNDLRESRSEITGKAAGTSALWGYMVAAAGIALALISHFIK